MLDPIGGGQHVLQVAATHVEQIRVLELFSVAGRTAVVGSNHDVSLIRNVLNDAIERIYRLRGGPAMHVNNRGTDRLARQVVGHVNERGNRPLAIAARIVNQVGLDHVLAAHSCHQRVGHLMRFAGRQ